MPDLMPAPDAQPKPSAPATAATYVQPVSPTGQAVMTVPPWLGAVVGVLVAVAGALPLVPGLPPVVVSVCGVVVAIGAALGFASAGVRK